MELAKISHLLKLADIVRLELDEKELGLRKSLAHVTIILRSAQQKLEKMGGHGCLDEKLMERLKYGLHRIEFYVNEIRITDPKGSNRKGYLRKLAKDVLQDVPTFTDPEKEGQSLVREAVSMIRKEEIDEIIDLLLSDDSNSSYPVSIVPILGMSGTGKTSLLRLVYNQQEVISHFRQIWVDIYPDLSVNEMGKEIYYKASPFPKYQYAALPNAILNLLKQEVEGSRCLLVLRDLSNDQDFGKWIELLETLLVLFAECKHGSKILVTCRSTFVEPRYLLQLPIAKDAAYQLKPLQLNESLVYFQSIAFKVIAIEDRNPHLINIGFEILNKCANNLQAISIVASILSSGPENLEKWEYLNNILLASVENPVKYIRSAVDLMQKHMAFTDAQPLLAYSSLFPLDYKFDKLELQQLWEVQGLYHQVPFEEIFNVHFEKLLVAEYFFEYKKSDKNAVIVCYTIQTLMHEVVKHLARDNYRLMDKATKKVDAQHVSFIVDSSWEAPSWLYDAKVLKTLLFLPRESCRFVAIPDINNILGNLKSLQALDLAFVNCRICPDSLRELKQLRYLSLGISFESLPECITNLKYLITLDLRHSAIRELPKSFHKLCYLKHLYTGGRLIDLPPKFGELRDLQTLDVFIVGQNNGLDALFNILPLVGKLKICYQESSEKHALPDRHILLSDKCTKILSRVMLDDLSLVWSSLNEDPSIDTQQQEDVMEFEFLQPPSSLTSLAVQGWRGVSFPQWVVDWFSTLPNNLRYIHVTDCRRCRHLPPSFSSLSNLESLQLRGLDALEFIEIFKDFSRASVTEYFPSLKYLILLNLPQLKWWSKVEDHDVDCQQQKHEKQQYVPHKILNCLSELKVSGCPELMSMPLVPSLESLEAVDIHTKLLKRLLSSQESPASSSLALSAFPTLKELHINSVHKLESLSITITSLQVLTITKCTDLTNVLIESSNSLKRLKIQACHRLKDISRAMHQLTILEELEIENCEELDWVDMMDNIEENSDDSVRASSQCLNSLRSLIVTNFTKPQALPRGIVCLKTLKELSLCWLYNLTDLPESIGYLTQLSRLGIRFCPKLKKLPESFPNLKSLKYLEMKECPKLERRCKQPYGEDCKLIDHIPSIHLGKFWYTGEPEKSFASEALKTLRFLGTCEVPSVQSFPERSWCLAMLQELHNCCTHNVAALSDWISDLAQLQYLVIKKRLALIKRSQNQDGEHWPL